MKKISRENQWNHFKKFKVLYERGYKRLKFPNSVRLLSSTRSIVRRAPKVRELFPPTRARFHRLSRPGSSYRIARASCRCARRCPIRPFNPFGPPSAFPIIPLYTGQYSIFIPQIVPFYTGRYPIGTEKYVTVADSSNLSPYLVACIVEKLPRYSRTDPCHVSLFPR